MIVHSRARTCPASRALLVERVRRQGWSVAEVAAAAGISERTAYKWLARQPSEGPAGLHDRNSRPRRSPRRTPEEWRSVILELRQACHRACKVPHLWALKSPHPTPAHQEVRDGGSRRS